MPQVLTLYSPSQHIDMYDLTISAMIGTSDCHSWLAEACKLVFFFCAWQVGNLPEKKIPVHVNVSGTPLIMQLSKVLLPGMPQNPPAAQPLAQPLAKPQSRAPTALTSGPAARLLQRASDKLPPGMNLDFGQLLAGTEAERCFYVFNTASLPVQLDWTFYR